MHIWTFTVFFWYSISVVVINANFYMLLSHSRYVACTVCMRICVCSSTIRGECECWLLLLLPSLHFVIAALQNLELDSPNRPQNALYITFYYFICSLNIRIWTFQLMYECIHIQIHWTDFSVNTHSLLNKENTLEQCVPCTGMRFYDIMFHAMGCVWTDIVAYTRVIWRS